MPSFSGGAFIIGDVFIVFGEIGHLLRLRYISSIAAIQSRLIFYLVQSSDRSSMFLAVNL